MIAGTTRLYAVLGHPVRHSRSPDIYNPLFAEHGIDAVYVALEVAPDRSDRLAEAIRTLGLAGVNLTVPHKHALLPWLDEISTEAEAIGAVNVVVNEDGRLCGFNTDGAGFVEALRAEHGVSPAGLEVVILGAGGAAAAVASALAGGGAARVSLLNRTVGRAERLAERLQGHHPGTPFDAGALDPEAFARRAPRTDLVVVATSGPAGPTLQALDLDRLPARCVVSDLNYWMPDPPLLSAARARGLRVQDGLGMLAWQGALAFEHFTGLRADAGRIAHRLR